MRFRAHPEKCEAVFGQDARLNSSNTTFRAGVDLNNWSGPARRLFAACTTGFARKADFESLSEKAGRFCGDERGNFAMITAILLVPLLLAGMVAIDATNLMRARNNVQAALDAAALAVGKRFSTGASEADMKDYGGKVFNVNLTALSADRVTFAVQFPQTSNDNQQIEATANFIYPSLFGSIAAQLTNSANDWDNKQYTLSSFVRLKNTVEVALVLDNSASMTTTGAGSNKQRMQLLKDAATQLVDTMAAQSALITRVEKPVQFSLVPFAGSVNVGPQYANAAWMDTLGLSPVHYENFNLPTSAVPLTVSTNQNIILKDGKPYKSGTGWGTENGELITRFSLYKGLKIYTSSSKTSTKTYTASWKGCVEMRPGQFAIDDTTPTTANPATLFVPMFAPDEVNKSSLYNSTIKNGYPYTAILNHWWPDNDAISTTSGTARQRDMTKYFLPAPYNFSPSSGMSPDYSCTTQAITPLTDVSTTAGKTLIQNAIKSMVALGGTNVPQGLVWGWHTVSSGAPFSEGRSETERGNDKVVIVLTDGANTYYSLKDWGYTDYASLVSYYSSYGYTGQVTPGYNKTRIFQNTTSANSSTNTNANYTVAMNEQFAKLCDNAKAANIILMTVALDLDETLGNAADKQATKSQIDVLKTCSSDSRVRLDGGKPAKLFWNTTGGNLSETFRQIGDELSNLRISG